jgi:drug/metabolite transporter (DMT)-like permease
MVGQNKRKGIMYTITASTIFGISPIFLRLCLNSLNIETTNILQSIFACLFFLIIFLLTRGLQHYKTIVKNFKQIGLLGLVTSVSALFYAEGILISGPTKALFIMQFVAVFNLAFGILIFKERFTKFEGVGASVSVFGVFMLAYGEMSVEIAGTLVLLAASFLVGLTSLLSKTYLRKISPLALAGGTPLYALIFISSYSLLLGKVNTTIPSSAIFYAAIASLTGIVVSFILFYKALEIYDLSKVSALRTIEPFLTTIWAFLILSERPTTNQLIGGSLIVIGIVFLIIIRKKAKTK